MVALQHVLAHWRDSSHQHRPCPVCDWGALCSAAWLLLGQVPNRKLPATPPNATFQTVGQIRYPGFNRAGNLYNCTQGGSSQNCILTNSESFCPVDVTTSDNPESPCAAMAVGDRGAHVAGLWTAW